MNKLHVILATILINTSLFATTYYVSASRSDDSGNGQSWATAKKTIQAAVDLTMDGDMVLVTNGLYNTGSRIYSSDSTPSRLVITNTITVKSLNGPIVTIIEGSGISTYGTESAVRGVCIYRATLEGFTIRSGAVKSGTSGNNGGGVTSFNDTTSGIVRNCIITNNKARGGGGICCVNTVDRCIISDNVAVGEGGGVLVGNIHNSLIMRNSAGIGGSGISNSTGYNTVIYGNNGGWSSVWDSTLLNSICIGTVVWGGSGRGYVQYSCTSSAVAGTGNITADPKFIDAANGDFRLRTDSPCRDVGNNAVAQYLADLDGKHRVLNGTVDMGAYEFGTDIAIIYYVSASRPDDSGNGQSWATAKKTIQAAVNIALDHDNVLVTNGTYNTGVTVTPGYALSNRVVITKDINVKSVNGAAHTIIEGSGIEHFGLSSAVRCVYMTAGKLDGFTMQKGTTLGDLVILPLPPFSPINSGGGVCLASAEPGAEVSNCIIINNKAQGGGGVSEGLVRDSVVAQNTSYFGGGGFYAALNGCVVSNNSASSGGGVYRCAATNCLFVSNTAVNDGGGTCEGTFTSCTIVNNTAREGAGTFAGTVINSIVTGNKYSGVEKNYYNGYCTTVFQYSCTKPLPPGTGNINADPLFVNETNSDYHLKTNSPCRNAGNNTYIQAATDLDGKPRIINGTVDMGAYEQGSSTKEGLVAHYPFNGNANDMSGNGNNGVINGATLTTDRHGRANSAYLFDGVDDYINCGSLLRRFDIFTYSMWFARQNNPVKDEQSIGKRRASNGGGTSITFSGASITGGLNREPIVSGQLGVYGGTVNTNWHHVVLTCDGTNLAIYCDGVLKDSRVLPVGAAYSSEDLWIGRGFLNAPDGAGVRAYTGKIDDVRIYDQALSASDVVKLMDDEWEVSEVQFIGETNGVKWVVEDSGSARIALKLGGTNVLADGEMAGVEWSVTGLGVLSFDWKVSSEADWDWLSFYENGAAQTNRISGITSWARQSVTILGPSEQTHTFRWEYQKDPFGDYVGDDCGWVDAITWTPFYTVSIENGTGDGLYTNGSPVMLTADEPAQYFEFDRWTGDTNTIANIFSASTTLRMPNTNTIVTATYKPILYTLSASNASGGGTYPYATAVEIRATSFENKRFLCWTGDVTSVANVNAVTTTVVTSDHTISLTATYSVPLTVNSGTGSGWYPEGTLANVSANADPMWKEFAVWTGDAGLLSNANARTTTLTLPTAPASVTATYRDSIARLTGSFGRTYSASGTVGAITPDEGAGSLSGTPAVKLGGAGVIPDNGFAAFETVVAGSGSILFSWKVSSESNGDYLKFKVDGGEVAAISGTKGPWTQVSNRVATAGSHTLRWEYVKNGSVAGSTDAGWVDDIIWVGDVPSPVIRPDIRTANFDTNLLTLSFLGERGIPYTVYSNATLSSMGWEPMALLPQEKGETNGLFRFEAIITPNPSQPACFYRILGGQENRYLIIDLSGGTNAVSYPLSYLDAVPAGGWTDEYKSTKFVLRKITKGSFTMGSPLDELGREVDEVQHEVTLTKDFYIGVFEVTQRQWELVMGNKPSYFNNVSYYATRPVEQVSYYDIRENPANNAISPNWPASSQVHADSFMGKLRTKTGLPTFDLPTESQWEYASRADTTTALNIGYNLTSTDSDLRMDMAGRYYYNGGSNISQDGTTSVGSAKAGSYLPNTYGLYDMHGNVWEWCLDWYGAYTFDVNDPLGVGSGSVRGLRGGCLSGNAWECRSAFRGSYSPKHQSFNFGFRAAMTQP